MNEKRPVHLVLWGAALTVLVSAAYATHLHFLYVVRGQGSSLVRQFTEAAAHVGVWALLVPVVVRFAHRAPRARVGRIAFHVVTGIAVAIVQVAVHSVVDQTLIHGEWTIAANARAFANMFTRTFYANLVVYLAIVVAHRIHETLLERRTLTDRLERELATAQLQALRNRLHPHFLFNALNSVAALVRSDPGAAELAVMRLSELLRAVLRHEPSTEIALREEMELVRRYLEIEKVRFEERLVSELHLPPQLENALVPPFILQPLVENAISHGLAENRGATRIAVEAAHVGRFLRLCVINDGRQLEQDRREGVGLSATRDRLIALYGQDVVVKVFNAPAGGVEARIEFPLRHAS